MKSFLIAICLMLSAASYAQKATIEKVWIDHGQTRNGEKGMLIHVKFNVENAQGHNIYVQAWIQQPKGTYLKSTNSNYRGSDGWTLSKDHGTATYQNSVWNDFKLWMPLSAFSLAAGKNIYYVRIDIYDDTINKHISIAPGYCSFSGTGSAKSDSQAIPTPTRQNSWRQDLGNGGYANYTRNADGSVSVVTVSQCIWCHGTKICSICNGAGGRYGSAYGGMWYTCKSCGGTKVCNNCHGKGTTTSVSQIAADGTGYSIDENGRMVTTGGSSTSGGYSSTDRNSTSSRHSGTCPKCGGRRYESASHEYAAASSYGWAQPYHNNLGNNCPYCGYASDHYHYPCTECHGFGHN